MRPFSALLRKDVRQIRFFVLIGVLIVILGDLFFAWKAMSDSDWLGASIIFPTLHLFYLPFLFLYSLMQEKNQLHYWLHTPRPVWQLTLSKLLSATGAFIISMSVSAALPFYMLITQAEWPHLDEQLSQLKLLVSGASWFFSISSFYLCAMILLIWALYYWLRTFAGKWVWVPVVLLVSGLNYALSYLSGTSAYQAVTRWGAFGFASEELRVNPGIPEFANLGFLYTGEWIAGILQVALIFWLACWLLDKKVEL
ncbi:hypothetical protein [Salinithrix halophila]|uniref:ABC-2 type transport system permease protein n=1 Tax=Salinithrix halophila TaxID=1485204 RepID=A0ABV8JI92_9BACL